MARPLVASGTDPEQVKRAKRKVEQRENQIVASIAEVMATPAGRFVLWTLLEATHVYQTSFDHSGSVMYFREGERNVGLAWRARILAADERLYEVMEREARHRERRLDAELATVQDASATAAGEDPNGSEG